MSLEIISRTVRRFDRSFTLVPVMAILMAGCSFSVNGSASEESGVQAMKAGGATNVNSTAVPNRLTTALVTDPGLKNMAAMDMTIPAGWKLQGIIMHPPCTPFPSPVSRAYSPDGLTQMRQEPLLGWHWDSQFKIPNTGCANISGVVSAADFLKYYVTTIPGGLHVVGSMPVSASYSAAAQKQINQFNANNNQGPPQFQLRHTGDTAALRVQVINGSFIIEERLRDTVICGVNNGPTSGNRGRCVARVDVLSAPQGKLDALVRLADSNDLPHGKVHPDWQQALLQQLSEQNAREGERRMKEAGSNPRHSAI